MAISSVHCHPVEHLFSNILPLLLSAYYSGMNFYTARVWHIFTVTNSMVLSHGGYKIPFSWYKSTHNIHHTKIIYNYGILGFLDVLHGTYREH